MIYALSAALLVAAANPVVIVNVTPGFTVYDIAAEVKSEVKFWSLWENRVCPSAGQFRVISIRGGIHVRHEPGLEFATVWDSPVEFLKNFRRVDE